MQRIIKPRVLQLPRVPDYVASVYYTASCLTAWYRLTRITSSETVDKGPHYTVGILEERVSRSKELFIYIRGQLSVAVQSKV